jgi:Inositol polyphosphate kinase
MKRYVHQVGGHAEIVKPLDDSKCLLKPLIPSEYAFYRIMNEQTRFSKLVPFTAKFLGKFDADSYVELEDLTYNMRNPCILDLKMGLKQRTLYTEKSLQHKMHKALIKSMETTSHLIGFRLGGELYWKNQTKFLKDKYEGRVLSQDGLYNAIGAFLPADKTTRDALIQDFISKLHLLTEVLENLNGVRFWSGSLLLVYDASDPIGILKMIDFAQAGILEESLPPDKEYLYGITNLIRYLNAIKQEESFPPIPDINIPDPSMQDLEFIQLRGTC